MVEHKDRGHSPLGASGAERWLACPGSVALLRELKLPESDEPDYRREGTAMHEAAAHCLDNHLDTWEIVGAEFNKTMIDVPMADAIQVYLDTVRQDAEQAPGGAGVGYFVEYAISSPVHEDFYGTLDFGALLPTRLVVADLKGGEGIIVDPDDNPQLKYYAFGIIDGIERQTSYKFLDEHEVLLRIVQPRGFSPQGPVREWTTTVGALKEWVTDTLVPAMARTEYDDTLDAGPWCRFCPAKLVCPLLTSLFGAAAKANPAHVVNLNAKSLGRSYQYVEAVKFYLKALNDETMRRLNSGKEVPGTKLVNKKANRVFKDGAADLAKAKFGDDVYTKPEMKSPAEIERLGPEGKEFVKEFAYTPATGLTVAMASDPRMEVKVKPAADVFAGVIAAMQEGEACPFDATIAIMESEK